MIKCPKCETSNINSPSYHRKADILVYRCRRCGYTESRLPLDAAPCPRNTPPDTGAPTVTPDERAAVRARSVGDRMALREILRRAREALATPYRPLKETRQQIVNSIDALAAGSTAHTDVSRLLDALEQAEGERDRYRAALDTIRAEYGGVCPDYTTCSHRACSDSHAAWQTADDALGPREDQP